MPSLLAYTMLFTGVAVFFIFIHLLIGRLVRPNRPDAEKKTIYECGEPTIGSSWIQFDLRFYVVALLFVVFDVEMAFFFPWAVVFGTANQLADKSLPPEKREQLQNDMNPAGVGQKNRAKAMAGTAADRYRGELAATEKEIAKLDEELKDANLPVDVRGPKERERRGLANVTADFKKRIAALSADEDTVGPSRTFALIAFGDILVFFVVLVVGFAYLWKRGDLDWVRSTAAQH